MEPSRRQLLAGLTQLRAQRGGRGKVHGHSGGAGAQPHADGQMGLAPAGVADQHQIAVLADELTAAKLIEEGAGDAPAAAVELQFLEGPRPGKARLSEPQAAAVLPALLLLPQHQGERQFLKGALPYSLPYAILDACEGRQPELSGQVAVWAVMASFMLMPPWAVGQYRVS